MPKTSRVTNKVFKIPTFASEAEEAEWWFANRERLGDLIAKHGRIVPGRKVAPTQAISIRLAAEDIAAAKRLGKVQGIGYQTVLKQALHDGMKNLIDRLPNAPRAEAG